MAAPLALAPSSPESRLVLRTDPGGGYRRTAGRYNGLSRTSRRPGIRSVRQGGATVHGDGRRIAPRRRRSASHGRPRTRVDGGRGSPGRDAASSEGPDIVGGIRGGDRRRGAGLVASPRADRVGRRGDADLHHVLPCRDDRVPGGRSWTRLAGNLSCRRQRGALAIARRCPVRRKHEGLGRPRPVLGDGQFHHCRGGTLPTLQRQSLRLRARFRRPQTP